MDRPKQDNITFQSVTLFKELLINYQSSFLVGISNKCGYPEFRFIATESVMNIVNGFKEKHNSKCDRSVEDWTIFDNTIKNEHTKTKTIVTRNINVVIRILLEGYGYMIIRTAIDKYGKRFYMFYANDRIIEIKKEEDIKSKERYIKKTVTAQSKEKI